MKISWTEKKSNEEVSGNGRLQKTLKIPQKAAIEILWTFLQKKWFGKTPTVWQNQYSEMKRKTTSQFHTQSK